MLKKHLSCLLTCIILLSATSHASEINNDKPNRVRIGAHPYAPYYNSQGQGLWADIYRAAYATQGIEVDIIILPTQRVLPQLLQHKIDAHSPGAIFLRESKENLILVNTTKVIGTINCFCLSIETNKKFDGKSIGLIRQLNRIKELEALGARMVIVDTPQQMVKMSHNQRIDYFGSTLISSLLLIEKLYPQELSNEKSKKSFKYGVWDIDNGGLAFSRNSPHSDYFSSRFKAGFELITTNGTYLKIMEDYWGADNVPRLVLPDAIQRFGIEHVNLEQFSKAKRNDYFKIVN